MRVYVIVVDVEDYSNKSESQYVTLSVTINDLINKLIDIANIYKIDYEFNYIYNWENEEFIKKENVIIKENKDKFDERLCYHVICENI